MVTTRQTAAKEQKILRELQSRPRVYMRSAIKLFIDSSRTAHRVGIVMKRTGFYKFELKFDEETSEDVCLLDMAKWAFVEPDPEKRREAHRREFGRRRDTDAPIHDPPLDPSSSKIAGGEPSIPAASSAALQGSTAVAEEDQAEGGPSTIPSNKVTAPSALEDHGDEVQGGEPEADHSISPSSKVLPPASPIMDGSQTMNHQRVADSHPAPPMKPLALLKPVLSHRLSPDNHRGAPVYTGNENDVISCKEYTVTPPVKRLPGRRKEVSPSSTQLASPKTFQKASKATSYEMLPFKKKLLRMHRAEGMRQQDSRPHASAPDPKGRTSPSMDAGRASERKDTGELERGKKSGTSPIGPRDENLIEVESREMPLSGVDPKEDQIREVHNKRNLSTASRRIKKICFATLPAPNEDEIAMLASIRAVDPENEREEAVDPVNKPGNQTDEAADQVDEIQAAEAADLVDEQEIQAAEAADPVYEPEIQADEDNISPAPAQQKRAREVDRREMPSRVAKRRKVSKLSADYTRKTRRATLRQRDNYGRVVKPRDPEEL